MKSTGSVSRNAPNRPPRTQTIVLLSVFIILSAALTLLSGSNLKVLNGYYESGSSSSTSESRRQQQRKHQPQPPTPHNLTPAKTLLDPNVRYLSYLPFAGLTNQFMGLQNAMYAAKLLNRTLIIPPIVSNVHDNDNTHQRWSLYFDMQKFTNLTGVQVVEWDSVRPLTDAQRQVGRDQANWATALGRGGAGGGGGGGGGGGVEPESDAWAMVAENITCQIIYGYGTPRMVTSPSARNVCMALFVPDGVTSLHLLCQPGMKTWDNVQLSGGQATWEIW
ncbi:hypothetical protein B0O80DRAFT_534672 [Mortierella sp. GBAus27b]|nr:hypothetical protein B0O80DRAFT_534672 [Mortierella sp. GBAus27b]